MTNSTAERMSDKEEPENLPYEYFEQAVPIKGAPFLPKRRN